MQATPLKVGFAYSYVYNYTDHLGNIRLSYAMDPETNVLTILDENHYYPFGLKHTNYNSDQFAFREKDPGPGIMLMAAGLDPVPQFVYNYKYNGKEFQDEMGMNIYDYGARNYDPAIGRWVNMDPLAERRIQWSPYAYCLNNPILRYDPNGLTDFTFNKKTGEIKQVGEKNDDPDRILKTNRKGEVKYGKNGEAKVAFGGIEQGILKDGQNFKNKDQVINTGGEGQPSVAGVKSFTLKLSEYIGKEIKGFSYSSDGSGNVTDMVLTKYQNNKLTSSFGSTTELQKKYGNTFSFNNVVQQFHTHPDGELGATQSDPEISQDVKALRRDKGSIPNATFIILYQLNGHENPAEYDYTHEYRPK